MTYTIRPPGGRDPIVGLDIEEVAYRLNFKVCEEDALAFMRLELLTPGSALLLPGPTLVIAEREEA